MARLSVFRRGWQNEHLAAFLLSKFAFVASPMKIGDDLGTDFFCTYFDTLVEKKKEYLIPKNSFAIQVKSSGRIINVTKQIKYLLQLELPFFIGIVNQKESKIAIYSGEYLPIFFSHKGPPTSLKLKLCPDHDFKSGEYFIEEKGDNRYQLMCPKVATLSTKMNDHDIIEETKLLIETAKRTHRNISSQVSNEYIFETGDSGNTTAILAGPGSNKVFRNNFIKRLAEVFYNLEWIHDNLIHEFDIKEFQFYERIYNEMSARQDCLPQYLVETINQLKEKVKRA